MDYNFVKEQEGFRKNAYKDTAGVWTIGYGQTKINGRAVKKGDVITKKKADEQWPKQIDSYAGAVKKSVLHKLSENETEALVSLCYNIGIKRFQESTVLRLINDKASVPAIAAAWQMWRKINGKDSAALLARRRRELNHFGIYGFEN